MARQELNVYRMRLLGAEVRGVSAGSATLKDAINEAYAGLGYECTDDLLHSGERAGVASLSDDGAGLSAGDQPGGSCAVFE